MKKDRRIVKAIAVIIIVGIGWIHNLDNKSFLYEQFRPLTVSWENDSNNNDSLQVKENKLFIYTKNIINSSIQHIISNL